MGTTSLTKNQKQTLRDAALANPTALGFITEGNDIALASWFNEQTTTLAWKNNMPWVDFFEAMDGTEYQSRTNGERDYIRELRESGLIDFSKNKFRIALQNAFNGVGARTVACRMSIWNAATEFATRAETILGGNVSVADTVSALRRSCVLSTNGVGNISYNTASDIRVS